MTKPSITAVIQSGVVKCGGYRYDDGTRYIGDWNCKGQKHGMGHLLLPDNTRYDGAFSNGVCSGLGTMTFGDGAKYYFLFNKYGNTKKYIKFKQFIF